MVIELKISYIITCQMVKLLTLKALNIFKYKPWRPNGFIQLEIIINVLVMSF